MVFLDVLKNLKMELCPENSRGMNRPKSLTLPSIFVFIWLLIDYPFVVTNAVKLGHYVTYSYWKKYGQYINLVNTVCNHHLGVFCGAKVNIFCLCIGVLVLLQRRQMAQ